MSGGIDPYVYPGTDVLINKLGFREASQAAEFEAQMVAQRLSEDLPRLPLTAEGYRRLHHHLFQDVYDWAGQDRIVEIAKNNDLFCRAQFIDDQLERRFNLIRKDGGLQPGATPHQFAARAADHLAEINAIHPFREGNGRTLRAFLENLAVHAGFEIEMERIQPGRWNKASRDSFRRGDTAPMRDVIAEAILGRS